MPFWPNRRVKALTALVAVVTLLYPAMVYFARDAVSPSTFIAVVVVMLALRLVSGQAFNDRAWRFLILGMASGVLLIGLLDTPLAVRAYPVLMSLSVAALFWHSRRHPPSLIERFARLRYPDLPPEGVQYCQRVTMVWAIFLVFNALVAAATALWGSLALWSLWTGLISYLLTAALFLGEMAVRPFLLRHHV